MEKTPYFLGSDHVLHTLATNYSDPRRKYHNAKHVADMFVKAKEFGIELTSEQKFAILYHDVIYDPFERDNEEKSAKFARDALTKFGVTDEKYIDKVLTIIMDTKTMIPTIPESIVVLDLDLIGFSLDNRDEKYSNLQKCIYDELKAFERENLPITKVSYGLGRTGFLMRLLNRSPIYRTEAIHDLCEATARLNILNEITMLIDDYVLDGQWQDDFVLDPEVFRPEFMENRWENLSLELPKGESDGS